ncbi:hypothetical protein LAZ67_8001729 [Cordylochernes scorpioides]|uniref:Reverse transcriptase n=1 Tax=Cordylochernes scorpioides TaxID=51811 RepID=A0ABY6KS18_9ARAC|nr:hypothetical protein LAZ67_8001729 [Cordylochernes scorpioides]
MKAGPYVYVDGRRDVFITLHEGITIERLPTRLDINIKGQAWPAYLSSGIRCSRYHGQGHRRAICLLLAGLANNTRIAPPTTPAGVPPPTTSAPPQRSAAQPPAPAPSNLAMEVCSAPPMARAVLHPSAPRPSPPAAPALPMEETPSAPPLVIPAPSLQAPEGSVGPRSANSQHPEPPPARPDFVAPRDPLPAQKTLGPAAPTPDVEMSIVEETSASSTTSAKNATRVDLDAFIERHPSVSFAGTDALGLGREEVLDLLSSRTKAQRKGPLLSPPQCDALAGLIGQILDLRPGAASNLYKVLGQVKAELRTTPAAVPTPPPPAPRPAETTSPALHGERTSPDIATPPPPLSIQFIDACYDQANDIIYALSRERFSEPLSNIGVTEGDIVEAIIFPEDREPLFRHLSTQKRTTLAEIISAASECARNSDPFVLPSDLHPLPLIETVLDNLSKARVFSTVDISNAYYQIPIAEESQPLLSFVTQQGQYNFKRLPFGFKSAPQIFERVITQLIHKHHLSFIAHYYDDFVIFSDSSEQHLTHLRLFFKFCLEENLQLNLKKCNFYQNEIDFLGYHITAGTYTPNIKNTEIINAIRTPINIRTLQSFLGAVNVYHKFIPEYAGLRHPLNQLLKKNAKWLWSPNCQQAFDKLKQHLATQPVLHLFQEGLPCQVYCDASTQGIAGVLKQVHPDGNIYPVQYYSRALLSYERNYTISELECLAIVECVDKFRVYLLGTKFVIYSDHHALQWLKTIKYPTGRFFRWSLRLSAYDYEVKYLKGSRQYEADLLSRNPFCGFLSTGQIKDHQGELRRDTRTHVRTCSVCQLVKPPKGPIYGELGQLPPAVLPYELVSLDTISGFAKYGNSQTFLHVVVDHATRYAWAFPSRSTSILTYTQVIEKVMQFGSPKRLLTDRAPAFTSPKFRRFMIRHNIGQLLTTSNNPQANGLSKRLNATITGKLKLLRLQQPKTAWTKLLPQVLQAYNHTPHSVTGFPPSYLLLGSFPLQLSEHVQNYPKIDDARELANQRTHERHLRDKARFDQTHRASHFEVGDLVLAKTYHHPDTGKLAPFFSGPYEILEIISPQIVRIDRSNRPLSRETDTIHVNKLKHYTENEQFISPPSMKKTRSNTTMIEQTHNQVPQEPTTDSTVAASLRTLTLCFDQLLNRESEEAITYDGDEPAAHLFSQLESQPNFHNLEPARQARKALSSLRGEPRKIAQDLVLLNKTYEEVKKSLCAVYPRRPSFTLQEFYELKCTSMAEIETYYKNKVRIGLAINLPKSAIVQALSNGVPPLKLPNNDHRARAEHLPPPWTRPHHILAVTLADNTGTHSVSSEGPTSGLFGPLHLRSTASSNPKDRLGLQVSTRPQQRRAWEKPSNASFGSRTPPKLNEPTCTLNQHTPVISLRPYRTPYAYQKEIQDQISQLLKHDIITPSSSPYSSPVTLVRNTCSISVVGEYFFGITVQRLAKEGLRARRGVVTSMKKTRRNTTMIEQTPNQVPQDPTTDSTVAASLRTLTLCLDQLLNREPEEAITYDGDEPAAHFFSQLESQPNFHNLEPARQARKALSSLRGEPRKIAQDLALLNNTYEEVKESLCAVYPRRRSFTLQEFYELKCTSMAEIEIYYKNKVRIGLAINLPKSAIVQALSNGVPRNYGNLLKMAQPSEPGEWLCLAQQLTYEGDNTSTKAAQQRSPRQSRASSTTVDKTPPYPCRYCGGQHWHAQCQQRGPYQRSCVDHATRYAWAFPSRSTSILTNTQVIKKVMQFGSPKRLLTDRAPAFTSPKFLRFLIRHNIGQLLTTSNNSQANGLSERLNATITGKLKLLRLQQPKTAWTKLLPQVLQAYNHTPHSVTGFPPSYLLLGSFPLQLSEHVQNYPKIDDARELAYQRTHERHLRDKARFDQTHRASDFKVGDLVLAKTYHHPDTGKLAPFFSGPYEILEIISPQIVRINRSNRPLSRETDTIHVNKLKHYTENEQFISPPVNDRDQPKNTFNFPYKHFNHTLIHTKTAINSRK